MTAINTPLSTLVLALTLSLGSLLLGAPEAQAQDVYFSQFYSTPALINPALSGNYQGGYRVFSQYRSQWGSILNKPVVDFAVGGDAVFDMPYSRGNFPDRVSASLIFLSDEYGAYDFGTNGINCGAAYHKSLSGQNHHYLSAAAQMGINTRNFIYENIVFADQFDGVNSFDLSTGENRPENAFAYFDLNVGLNWSISLESIRWIQIGISGQHVMQPNISFYENIEDPTGIIQRENPLLRRFNAIASLEYDISDRVRLIPRALVSIQDPFTLMQAGSNVRLAVGEQSGRAVQFGAAARAVSTIDGLALTEIQLLTGFEVEGLSIGLSYDLNISSFSATGQVPGSFEITFSYIGAYLSDGVECPKF